MGRFGMEKHVIGLERGNLAELEIVERLVAAIGILKFEADAQRLAEMHVIDPQAAVQSIPRSTHPSLIGMSSAPFEVMRRVSDGLVEREPGLLQRLSYRCRDDQYTAVPWEFWLDLVRHARAFFDPAKLDADFLGDRLREGLSPEEAFHSLIASKQNR